MRFFAEIRRRAGGFGPAVSGQGAGRGLLRRGLAALALCFIAPAMAAAAPAAAAYSGAVFAGPAGPLKATAAHELAPIPAAASAKGAQQSGKAQSPSSYSLQEVIDSGNNFFGSTSGGLAKAVQEIFRRYGLPNGYIQGQEGSGAFIVGLTYGEGVLYTKNAGDHKLFWQGPSVGFDAGGDGSRVMILVYKLRSIPGLWGRYGGVSGSAYFVAGVSFNVLSRQGVLLVPIRTGIGARLGVNINYLKLTAKPTWNPL